MEFGVDLDQSAVDLCHEIIWNSISMRIYGTFFTGEPFHFIWTLISNQTDIFDTKTILQYNFENTMAIESMYHKSIPSTPWTMDNYLRQRPTTKSMSTGISGILKVS